MNESVRNVYADVLAREVRRQGEVLRDPYKSLEELRGYIDETDDEALRRALQDEIHLKRVWGDVLAMAQLRTDGNFLWQQCEPVIGDFWKRVAPLVFREDDSLSVLLRSKLYETIFGEGGFGSTGRK